MAALISVRVSTRNNMSEGLVLATALTQLAFSAFFLLLSRQRQTGFLVYFSLAWLLEGLRLVLVLPPFNGFGYPVLAHSVQNVLVLGSAWLLIVAAYGLDQTLIRLRAWIVAGVVVLAVSIAAPLVSGSVPVPFIDWSWEPKDLLSTPNMGAALAVALLRFWASLTVMKSGVRAGAGYVVLPYILHTAASPLHFTPPESPDWYYLLWFGEIVVASVGLTACIFRDSESASVADAERYRAIFEHSPLGIYRTTPDGRVIVANPALIQMLGYSTLEEVGARNLENEGFGPTYPRSFFKEMVERKEGVKGLESAWSRKDGTRLFVRENARAIVDGNGRPLYYEGTVEDVTERIRAEEALRETEQQLAQAKKMEAVGRLAGGIAHDFSNLITTILGYSSLVIKDMEAASTLRTPLEEIQRAGSRAAELTRQLLAFGRKQELAPVVLDINKEIYDSINMLQRVIGEDVEIVTSLKPHLKKTKADKCQINQVMINLAANARDSMAEGGRFVIETANVVLDGAYCSKHRDVRPGSYIMLHLMDTGCGMDPETARHIFEPFFTTKSQGTGLGLSTVFGIVKQSGGHISVHSQPGLGTSFRIYLPAVEDGDGEQDEAVAEDTQKDLHGKETILLVEDSEQVRRFASLILANNGYRVMEAANGNEAFSLCARLKSPIDLLVTDVVMPLMGGRELANRLNSLFPGLKTLYMSGYPGSMELAGIETGSFFLQKPFTPNALCLSVRNALDSRRRLN